MSLTEKARSRRIVALEEISTRKTPRPDMNFFPVDLTMARIADDKRLNGVIPRRVTSRPVMFIHTSGPKISLAA